MHPARPHLFFAWRRGYQFGTHPTHLHKNSTVKSPTFEHTCSSRRKTSAPASSGESVGWLSPAPAQRGPAASICAQSHVDLSVSFRNLCLGFKSLVSRSILESTLRTQCVYKLSTDGYTLTLHTTLTIHPHLPQQALWWGRGIVGPSIRSFPHPQGWIVAGPDCHLDEVTVKKLTLAFTLPKQILPTCVTTWERRLGNIGWNTVGRRPQIP